MVDNDDDDNPTVTPTTVSDIDEMGTPPGCDENGTVPAVVMGGDDDGTTLGEMVKGEGEEKCGMLLGDNRCGVVEVQSDKCSEFVSLQ